MIDPFSLKRRPDQTSYTLNQLLAEMQGMKRSIRVISDDKRGMIIIGEQPVNPDTGKPYPFGIATYKVSGDRLIKEV